MKKTNKKSKKTNNKTTLKVTSAVLALLLIGGGCYIGGKYIMNGKNPGVIEKVPGDSEVAIKNQGITIKKLNTTPNPDGSVTRTFTYSVEPANATNPLCEMTLAYSDGTLCSEVVTGYLDPTQKIISVTNMGPFEKQIVMTVYSFDNPSIKATVTIDYEKKISAMFLQDVTFNTKWQGFSQTLNESLNVAYTPYTVDKNYTFNLMGASGTKIDVSDQTLKEKYSSLLMYFENPGMNPGMGENTIDIQALFTEAASKKALSAESLKNLPKNLDDTTKYQYYQLLADVVKTKSQLIIPTYLSFQASDETHYVDQVVNLNFDLSAMQYQASDFYVGIESITAESSSIVF